MLEPPYPELDDLLELMGEAGRRLSEIDATEGAAGNISVCIRWPVEPRTRFQDEIRAICTALDIQQTIF
jgi:rhamnulose-1-phosphate aldolase